MQQPPEPRNGERIVVVYTAATWTEAMVVRGLLESAGIPSPALGDGNPPDIWISLQGIEIYALETQAEHARQIIGAYLDSEEAEELGEL